ncbi:nose resistant to fluoxetine protein 6-like [Chironomus tepperi]|uniref:nose resistant to fluoxetine protein 6-like n=1 Tax=Chironomus tepperi TaxID=113505 RepID=UPI00391F8BBF
MKNKKIKILLLLAHFVISCASEEIARNFSEDEFIILKVASVISNESISSHCKSDLNSTINNYQKHKAWAVAMYDSSVKIPEGIEYGVQFQLGNFDQCMNISTTLENDGVNIQPKYCLVDVKMDGFNIRNLAVRNNQIRNSTLIHWAICMPSSCSNEDIVLFMKMMTGRDEISIDPHKCQVKEEFRFSKVDIIFGFTLLGFLLVVIICTIFHIYAMSTSKNRKSNQYMPFEEIVHSFSIIANLKKLGKESKDEYGLSCINGIKAVSMFCIISGHALVFMVGGPMQNSEFYKKQMTMIQNAFIFNSPLLVDSFLLLSGFLFARLVLIEMDKRRGRINFGLLYIFRYIRLTPAYLMMIGLYSTWFIKIGDGPLWKKRISLEQERCQISWWKNLLYINNYYGNDALCMFQSWYLAADTQLFILAPLLIYPLWKCRRVGLYLIGISASICVFIPFYITYTQNLDPTFMIFQDEVSDLSTNNYFIHTYGKTHMRAISYVIGILIGYIAFYIHKEKMRISNRRRNLMWILSSAAGIASMYGVTIYYIPSYKYSYFESALYNSLHRLGWSFFTGWLVLGCVTSSGSLLKKMLSSHILVPISRLTYCAYLTNGFIELYLAASVRTPRYMSVFSLTGETLSHVALTFLAALILCLMFESPIHGIEKILLRRNLSHSRDTKSSASDDLNDCAISTSSQTISTSEASA